MVQAFCYSSGGVSSHLALGSGQRLPLVDRAVHGYVVIQVGESDVLVANCVAGYLLATAVLVIMMV